MKIWRRALMRTLATLLPITTMMVAEAQTAALIGKEVAIPRHLQNGQEFQMPIRGLLQFGSQLFQARWTGQEGQGRPFTKGTGAPLSDPASPLVFPRNFDRLSGPDSNSCAGCHNTAFVGGGGDRVGEVFVLGQRFDFLTFDHSDSQPTRGAADELGKLVTMDNAFNERKTIGMNGSGFIEMLARQMTSELQAERNAIPPNAGAPRTTKGISFGVLTHRADGSWDTSQVQGIAAPSLTATSTSPPSLLIRPFHQVGNLVSVRQFTNNAFNHHHGIQSEERFGPGDADGDGFAQELTTADMTAVTMFQITLNVPGQVIPSDRTVRAAIQAGQQLFTQVGCASCHVPALPLTNNNNPGAPGQPGWIYTEPSPYNPPDRTRRT